MAFRPALRPAHHLSHLPDLHMKGTGDVPSKAFTKSITHSPPLPPRPPRPVGQGKEYLAFLNVEEQLHCC